MLAIRAALRSGQPPTKFWGLGDGRRYTQRDRLLVTALEYYELTVSSETGLSSYITTWGDYAGYFKVVEDADDLAAQVLTIYRDHRDKGGNPIRPEERFHVEFTFDPKAVT